MRSISYIKIFVLFLALVISPLVNASNIPAFSTFFQGHIQLLKKQSIAILEIHDNDDCPIIVTTDDRNLDICVDTDVTFMVVTDASSLSFDEIEFYRFTAAQTNPYLETGDNKKLIGKIDNTTGIGTLVSNDFEPINGINTIYYVYAVLSPTPSDLTDCIPFLDYIITAKSCQEICDNCTDEG